MTIQTMRDFGIGDGQLFIGGRWVDSASRERREIENPKDQSIVAAVASSTIEDADRAIAAARKAQPLWRRTTAAQRAALLNRFATLIDENAETLAQLLTAEGGKILRDSRIDVAFSALLLRYAAESARHIQGEIMPGENPDEQIWIQRVPYGVAVGITAWNFPAALFARKVGPALVTGNTIIIKPHEQTPLTTLVLAELSRRAGIPEGVINVIVGDGRTVGAHLVAHKGTDIISMTGSVRAGGEIYALGAEHIKPVRLELGGKAPFIVMEDADIDEAVEAAVASKFFAGGAVCTCNDRMYLHRAIHDDFMEKFIARVQKLTVGDPTTAVDIGPRINASEVTKLKAMVEQALKQKAAKLVDATPLKAEARGHWFYPTILSVDSNDLDIMKQETFGPVIAALAVDDFEQALAYANDSDFGLSAYVFTRDHRRIMRSVNELEFGEIYLNRASGESPHAHHVGYRKSGIGGEDGKHGIEGYLRKKTLYNNYA
ncbi:aldehyde dehydrogenase family protein [Mesorhizobium sp. BR1-1-16]|uniref:aldehyde dehydrogenase family protein n=1 Tax=Mesorhizobium sp. BR1-1-16 TaxID=2876653 RepID=UPI001CCD09B9|nr:aldehyde dehydrogenase family protein [Mesorhizobium sp. BR1-1-16]MBZ9938445.1 aldehyde dehydrogenase family protein [Mesorhizobium sp. BR1-1-16]